MRRRPKKIRLTKPGVNQTNRDSLVTLRFETKHIADAWRNKLNHVIKFIAQTIFRRSLNAIKKRPNNEHRQA